jgi:hypothetical protein
MPNKSLEPTPRLGVVRSLFRRAKLRGNFARRGSSLTLAKKMKFQRAVLFVVMLASSPLYATAPVSGIYGTGQWQDRIYAVSPSRSDIVAVKWNPEKEECPLSVPRALAIARASLRKMVGSHADLFRCNELKFAQENGYWFYVVRFYSDDLRVAKKGDVGMFPAILPFIVYLNGRPELPFEKKG